MSTYNSTTAPSATTGDSSSRNIGAEAGQRSGTTPPPLPPRHDLDSTAPLPTSASSSSSAPAPSLPPRHDDASSVHSTTTTHSHAPSHAASATTTTTHHSSSTDIGETLGSRTRGFFSAIHGAGEGIRGTINSALDGLGDGVAGRPSGTIESRSSANTEETVADKGKKEFQAGVEAMKGERAHHGTSNTGL
ncbi:hypothetical protein JCM8097_007755 [Rhodosporidiobolus ruineniae]